MEYVVGYVIILAVFLIGWKRWGDRMAHLDAEQERMIREMQEGKQ